jgi:hypothetical protein
MDRTGGAKNCATLEHLFDSNFTLRLGSDPLALRIRVELGGANVDESVDAGVLGNGSNATSGLDVCLLHLEVSGVKLTADKVDDDVGVLDSIVDGVRVADVPQNGYNLPNVTHDLQVLDIMVASGGAIRNDNLRTNAT